MKCPYDNGNCKICNDHELFSWGWLKENLRDLNDFILWENFTMTIIIPVFIGIIGYMNGGVKNALIAGGIAMLIGGFASSVR